MNSTLRAALLAVPLVLASLGTTGCVDPKGGKTGSTPIYVYDNLTKRVLVWDDINTLYDLGSGAAAPKPDRIITSSLISSLGTLAWGGMVMNPSTNELLLVDEAGNVVRIEKAASQNGSLTNIQDIASFTLGDASSDRLTNSVFGQAAIDPSTGTFYVCENGSSNAFRVWAVTSPNGIASGGKASLNTLSAPLNGTDYTATGVASAGSGNVYVFASQGNVIQDSLGDKYYGPRLRLSIGTSFPFIGKVLVGDPTQFWDGTNFPAWGTLGYDSSLAKIYVARPYNSDPKQKAILIFTPSQLNTGSLDQAPSDALPEASTALPNLRVISHARTKDWLVGIDQDSSSSPANTDLTLNTLRLWKQPSQKGASIPITLGPFTVNGISTSVGVRAVAMDGSI
jgi:hypothetical protein